MTTRRRWLIVSVALLALVVLGLAATQEAALWWGARDPAAEARELASLLQIKPGDVVAEIGAGGGEIARVIAGRVTPGGRLIVTEVSDSRLAGLHSMVSSEHLAHVEVRQGETHATALPDACCGVIYMRHVYHHFEDTAAMNASLRRTLAPGGRLAIIDFEPGMILGWIAPNNARQGHGVTIEEVGRELASAGLVVEHEDAEWRPGMFLIVSTRPSE
ncbi:MAG: class I SAM-dependent methyltransferase [Vicinamibacterales bacterium]